MGRPGSGQNPRMASRPGPRSSRGFPDDGYPCPGQPGVLAWTSQTWLIITLCDVEVRETARSPAVICADVVRIPMKVRATQIRLIWAGRAARDVDWILDPKDCYGHGGVGPQLARPA